MTEPLTPTPEECRQLAKAWPDSFEWDAANEWIYFYLGTECIAYCPASDRWECGDEIWPVDPALGLAALTWKCKEVADTMDGILTEIPVGDSEWRWAICNIRHDETMWSEAHGVTMQHPDWYDSPWAALLAQWRVEAG